MDKIYSTLLRTILAFLVLMITLPGICFSQRTRSSKPVQLLKVKIESDFAGIFVRNIAEFEFYNPNSIDSLLGRFSFRTNLNSFVQNLWLDIDGEYKIAETFSRKTGMRIFNKVTGRRLDPALLTTNGRGSYSLRVFPFDAYEIRRVKIEFYSILDIDKSDYIWSFKTWRDAQIELNFNLHFPNGFTSYALDGNNIDKTLDSRKLLLKTLSSAFVRFKFLPTERYIKIVGDKDKYIWNILNKELRNRIDIKINQSPLKIIEEIVTQIKLDNAVYAPTIYWRLKLPGRRFIQYLQIYHDADIMFKLTRYSKWINLIDHWVYKKDYTILEESLIDERALSHIYSPFIDKFKIYNEVLLNDIDEHIKENLLTEKTSKLVLEDNKRVDRIRSEELEIESLEKFYDGSIDEDILELDAPPPPPPMESLNEVISSDENDQVAFFKVSVKPKIIKKVPPEYPPLARMARIQGRVVIEIVVDKDGSVRNARIVKSNPFLDKAAFAAVKKWSYKPGELSRNRIIPVKMIVPVDFILDDAEEIPEYSSEMSNSDTTVWIEYSGKKFTKVLINELKVVIEKGFEPDRTIRINYASKEHFDLLYKNPNLIKYYMIFTNLAINVNHNWYLILKTDNQLKRIQPAK